jgi:tetratricopeptide (TPR) repeat protein
VALCKSGDLNGVLKDYDESIRLNPDDPMSYLNCGVVRDMLGDAAGAISDYDEAIYRNPGYAEAYL